MLTTPSNSEVAYRPCSAHLDGHDRFLSHDDQTPYPPATQYAQIRPRRQEEGALPGGNQGWTREMIYLLPRTSTIPLSPVMAIRSWIIFPRLRSSRFYSILPHLRSSYPAHGYCAPASLERRSCTLDTAIRALFELPLFAIIFGAV